MKYTEIGDDDAATDDYNHNLNNGQKYKSYPSLSVYLSSKSPFKAINEAS